MNAASFTFQLLQYFSLCPWFLSEDVVVFILNVLSNFCKYESKIWNYSAHQAPTPQHPLKRNHEGKHWRRWKIKEAAFITQHVAFSQDSMEEQTSGKHYYRKYRNYKPQATTDHAVH